MRTGTHEVRHNLSRLIEDKTAPPEGWALAFDGWIRDRLQEMDVEAILAYGRMAPQAALAVPTPEHLDPLFFVLGCRTPGDRALTLYEGFSYGSLSLRSFALLAS